MAIVDLVMPKLGESIMEATILKWHKQPGDHVNMDETVLEIATDKVDSEVPSTSEGVLEEIFFKVNDIVPVGTVIAKIKTGASETTSATVVPPGRHDTSFPTEDLPKQGSRIQDTKAEVIDFQHSIADNYSENKQR